MRRVINSAFASIDGVMQADWAGTEVIRGDLPKEVAHFTEPEGNPAMRKIIAFLMSSTDGYYEGPDRAFDRPVVDGDFNQFAVAKLDEADTLLFGRATYADMAAYWPSAYAERDDTGVTAQMNNTPKVVGGRDQCRSEIS